MEDPQQQEQQQQQQQEWWESAVMTDSESVPVTSVAFDVSHEMAWLGYGSGRVSSFLLHCCEDDGGGGGGGGVYFERYSAVQAHAQDSPVLALCPDAYGLCSLSPSCVKYHARSGSQQVCRRLVEEYGEMTCMASQRAYANRSRVTVAGKSSVLDVDLSRNGTVVLRADVQEPVSLVRPRVERSLLYCALESGYVVALDALSLKPAAHPVRLDAHSSGAVTSMDVCGDLLVTCGLVRNKRDGGCSSDQYVKVFDLRMNRLVAPMRMQAGECGVAGVRFLPGLSSTIAVVTRDMRWALQSIDASSLAPPLWRVSECPSAFTAMDICNSGEALLVADTVGHAHLWTSRPDFQVDVDSVPLSLPPPPQVLSVPPFNVDDLGFSFSDAPFPPQVITVTDEDEEIQVPDEGDGRPLASEWDPTETFPIPQPNRPFDPVILLPMMRSSQKGSWILVSELSNAQLKALATSQPALAKRLMATRKQLTSASRPPKPYRHFELDQRSRTSSSDLIRYNQTRLPGLDNCLPNSYCNALLQALYHVSDVREIFTDHLCERDPCLECELALLFSSLDTIRATRRVSLYHSARNFLRAFTQVPQTSALGILETRSTAADLAAFSHSFVRFLLDFTARELPDLEALCSLKSGTKFTCLNCSSVWTRTGSSLTIDLAFDPSSSGAFSRGVADALNRSVRVKSWCERCSHYQLTKQDKTVVGPLPKVLLFCVSSEKPSQASSPPPAKAATIPMRISIRFASSAGGGVTVHDVSGGACAPVDEVYQLCSVVCFISDPSPKAPSNGHLVSYCLVTAPGEDYDEGVWYLFNDLRVSPVDPQDVVDSKPWKRPCIVLYRKVGPALRRRPCRSPLQALNLVALLHGPTLNRKPVSSVLPTFLPEKGDLVAIDSEYVSLVAEKIVTELDGTRVVVTPSHLTVARVSCICGRPGPLYGRPFIDDYVCTPEHVVDYLTRFSGIEPGDLEPSTSRKRLTTLKVVYLKLKALVDRGCILVGHGLHKDLQILNLFVPPEQVVDTVELFHMEHMRFVSLKFLAAYLLRAHIQSENHCSLEDAATALELYRVYEELQRSGKLESVLQEIYQAGRLSNWQLPSLPR